MVTLTGLVVWVVCYCFSLCAFDMLWLLKDGVVCLCFN